jgi:hypothetical protein
MTEWTPGPWKHHLGLKTEWATTRGSVRDGYYVIWDEAETWPVAQLPGSLSNRPELTEANARLIAAAPEMAELLEEYAALVHSDYCGTREHRRCVDVRALLARIKGESDV